MIYRSSFIDAFIKEAKVVAGVNSAGGSRINPRSNVKINMPKGLKEPKLPTRTRGIPGAPLRAPGAPPINPAPKIRSNSSLPKIVRP